MIPVPGVAQSTPYGKRGPYWSCNKDSHGNGIHTGADYAAPAGSTVVAARPGQVVYCSHGAAFGSHQLEILPGDGTRDFYAHMNSRHVPNGVTVKAGDKIGNVGTEGNTTGPHLHFERHAVATGGWSCGVVRDPAPSINYQPAGSGGSGGGTGDDMPDYAHARITKPIHLKADEWYPIEWSDVISGDPDVFDGAGIRIGGHRYSATLSVRCTDRGDGATQTSWVERKGGETVEENPVASHGDVDAAVDTRNGHCGEDRALRARVRVRGHDATLEAARIVLLIF